MRVFARIATDFMPRTPARLFTALRVSTLRGGGGEKDINSAMITSTMHTFVTSCISRRFSHRSEGLIFEGGSNPDEEHANYFPAGLHGRFHCPAIAANKSVETNYCTAEATNKSVEVKFNHKLLLSSAYFTHSGVAEAEITKTLEELDELICRNKGYNMFLGIDANARMVVIQAELKT